MARRFLFTFVGGYGHFHPLAPLARALARAGHEVAFAAGPSLRPLVRRAGFAVFPLEANFAADAEYQRIKAQARALPPGLEAELFTYARIFCGVAPRLRTPELVAIAREWRPDMLVREAGEYAAVIAAEHLGLPHATVAFAAALRTMAIFEREAAAQLDPIRARWGLHPDPDLTALYRTLYLSYSPPTFALHEVDPGPDMEGVELKGAAELPATTRFIRADVFDNAGGDPLPAWVAELPDRPTIYATLGTELAREPEYYPSVLQKVIAGLRDAPVNLIVTVGRQNDPADFGPQPEHVRIERYIPQSLLLPHCDLMVMHGGSNSLLAALDVGLPMVVIPLIADQFFNARVLDDLRLGRVVRRDELSPEGIREAVEAVLGDPRYGQNVARLRAELRGLPDQRHAVALIEGAVGDRA